jgi:hypothetical protein
VYFRSRILLPDIEFQIGSRSSVVTINRRAFVAMGLALAASTPRAAAQRAATKLVLLGTGGGPRPRTASSGAVQVIISGAAAYVIDCGDDAARRYFRGTVIVGCDLLEV